MADSIFLLTKDGGLLSEIVPAFSQAGFAVKHTTDYLEALLKLKRLKPKLAIIDDDLSTTGGMEVYCRLHQELGVLVVILGDNPNDEGWTKVSEMNAELYIKKPVSCRELVARVKAILRRHYLKWEEPQSI